MGYFNLNKIYLAGKGKYKIIDTAVLKSCDNRNSVAFLKTVSKCGFQICAQEFGEAILSFFLVWKSRSCALAVCIWHMSAPAVTRLPTQLAGPEQQTDKRQGHGFHTASVQKTEEDRLTPRRNRTWIIKTSYFKVQLWVTQQNRWAMPRNLVVPGQWGDTCYQLCGPQELEFKAQTMPGPADSSGSQERQLLGFLASVLLWGCSCLPVLDSTEDS